MEKVYVYFILNPKKHEVKIGQSQDPFARLKQLEVEEKTKLVLLHYQEDVIPLERRLHNRFQEYRTRGEWFILSDEIINHIYSVGKKKAYPKAKRGRNSKERKQNYSGHCLECGVPVAGKMLYCSQPCKQRAYRRRQAEVVTA